MTSPVPAAAGVKLASAERVVAATFASQCAAAFGFLAVDMLAPSLAAETGLNKRDFAFGSTFVFLGVLLASPHAGRLIGQLGSVRLMASTMMAMAAFMLILLHGSWSATMLACAGFGLCYGLYSPTSAAVVASRTPARRRGLYLAIRQSGVPAAGAVVGRVLPPVILAWGWWAGAFTISAVLALGAGVTMVLPGLFRMSAGEGQSSTAQPQALATAPPAPGRATAPHQGVAASDRSVARRLIDRVRASYRVPPEIRLLAYAAVGFAISHTASSTFAYFYLLEVLGAGPIAAGVYLSNSMIASAIGRPVVGWLVDRTRAPVRVFACIGLLAAVAYGVLLSLRPDSPGWLIVGVAVAAGLSAGTWTPVYLTAVSNRAVAGQMAELHGRAFSYAALGWTSAAPLVWSLIELSGGYTVPFACLVTLNLLMAAAVLKAGDSRPAGA